MSNRAVNCDALNTGNDLPILHEIRHALAKLIDKGDPTTIDLRSIPMAPGEEANIESLLGEGEVSIKLDALGPSTITETAISGVWLVTHYNHEDQIIGKFIEITDVPSLVATQRDDLQQSLRNLTDKLANNVAVNLD